VVIHKSLGLQTTHELGPSKRARALDTATLSNDLFVVYVGLFIKEPLSLFLGSIGLLADNVGCVLVRWPRLEGPRFVGDFVGLLP